MLIEDASLTSTALLYLHINFWLKSMSATRTFYAVSYYFDHMGMLWSTHLVERFPRDFQTFSLQYWPDNTGYYKPEITNHYSEFVQRVKWLQKGAELRSLFNDMFSQIPFNYYGSYKDLHYCIMITLVHVSWVLHQPFSEENLLIELCRAVVHGLFREATDQEEEL